nr:MAG: capsid protein [Cressdnaviricota sp.]
MKGNSEFLPGGLKMLQSLAKLGRDTSVHTFRPPTKKRKYTSVNVQRGNSDAASDAITQYHDISKVYAKRPKKRSKKAKRSLKKKKAFKKKVTKAISAKCPMNTYLFEPNSISVVTAPAVNWNTTPWQVTAGTGTGTSFPRFVMGECGFDGNGNALTTGFSIYLQNFFKKLDTRWNGTDVIPPGGNNFQAGCMVLGQELNLAIQNISGQSINVDTYEVVAARNITSNDQYAPPTSAWQELIKTEASLFATGITAATTPSNLIYGCTPFDAPEFGRHWKVVSKTRMYLTNNQSTAMQFKNKPYYWREDLAQQYSARKGITKHIFFVVCSEIGFGVLASANLLNITTSKQYHFKFPATMAAITNGQYGVFSETY